MDCCKRGFRPLKVILVSSLAVPRQPICTQAMRGLSTGIIVCKRIMHFLEQASPPSVIVLFPCGFLHPGDHQWAVWVLNTEPLITVSVVCMGKYRRVSHICQMVVCSLWCAVLPSRNACVHETQWRVRVAYMAQHTICARLRTLHSWPASRIGSGTVLLVYLLQINRG